MRYRLELTPQALRDMERLPEREADAIAQHIDALLDDPHPPGAAALHGRLSGRYRVRVGNYRVGCKVDHVQRLVTVWQIGDRKHFYDIALRRS